MSITKQLRLVYECLGIAVAIIPTFLIVLVIATIDHLFTGGSWKRYVRIYFATAVATWHKCLHEIIDD